MKKAISLVIIIALSVSAFAQGNYMEYKISSAQGMGGTMKIFFQDGNSRSEMDMQLAQMPGGGVSNSSLYLKSNPGKVYMLNEKNKTYTEMEINKAENNTSATEEYEVTVIGKEKVNNYNATHVKIKRKGATTEMEMWTSTDVANYEKYQSTRSKYTSAGLYKALKEKGADGAIVRMVMGEHGHNMQMDLVKAESKAIEAAKFSLTGYTKSEASTSGANPNNQEMMEKLKNMSPEERKKFVEELRKKQGGQ
jgi:hypothetical protein